MTKRTEDTRETCRQALTLVFIEDQYFENLYDAQTAFTRGTLFEDLDKPLKAGGSMYER